MAASKVHSNKTELKDRTLWYDGDSTVPEQLIIKALSAGLPIEGLFVSAMSGTIEEFNKLVPAEQQIQVKKGVSDLNYDWVLPEEYKELDVERYVADAVSGECEEHDARSRFLRARVLRVAKELSLYKKMGLYPVLRTLIYVINTLRKNDVIWSVGRGSSVSSYVLYLIGVHDVDSIKYELEIEDFLRTEE